MKVQHHTDNVSNFDLLAVEFADTGGALEVLPEEVRKRSDTGPRLYNNAFPLPSMEANWRNFVPLKMNETWMLCMTLVNCKE